MRRSLYWRVGSLGVALLAGLAVAWFWARRDRPALQEAAAPTGPGANLVEEPTAPRGSGRQASIPRPPGSRPPVDGAGAPPRRDEPGDSAYGIYAAGGRHPRELYADERRTEPWATRRANELLAYPSDDIRRVDPDAKVEVDCRTSSCRIRVYSKSPFLISELGDYPFACMGRYTTADLDQRDPSRPDSAFADIYILFDGQNLDEGAFTANRDRTCPKYREQWRADVAKPRHDR